MNPYDPTPDGYAEPLDRPTPNAFDDPAMPNGFRPRRRRTSALEHAWRDPRRRMTIIVGAALALLLVVLAAWYGSPTNRARRALADANARIVDKQHEVDDARRLLAQRIAELRAARAEADLQATRYQGALAHAAQSRSDSVVVDTTVMGGEVIAPGAVGPTPSPIRP